jgi:hypothetical protein
MVVTTKLILTENEKSEQEFAHFSALVRSQRLDKIEKSIGIKSENEYFRSWLIKTFWSVDQRNRRGASIRGNRAALKNTLSKSADCADKLRESSELIWQSNEPSVRELLRDFVGWQEWQSSRPMHPSGIGWIDALDEFAKRLRLLAGTLPDDTGGPRPNVAFDDLLLALTDCFTARAKERKKPIDKTPIDPELKREFFNFVIEVTEVARNVWKDRPGAAIKVPPDDKAVRECLRRLTDRTPAR